MSRPRRDYRSAFLWKLKLLPPEGERRRGSCEWKETRGLCAALGGRLTQQGPTGRRTHFCHLFLESRLIRLEEISKRWVTGAATEKLLIWMLRGAHREFLGWGGTGGGSRRRRGSVPAECALCVTFCSACAGPESPPRARWSGLRLASARAAAPLASPRGLSEGGAWTWNSHSGVVC